MSDILQSTSSKSAQVQVYDKKDERAVWGNLGSNIFLKMMVEQMKNQDPTAPTAPGEFLKQLSSFGVIEQISAMNTNMQGLKESINMLAKESRMNYLGRDIMVPNSPVHTGSQQPVKWTYSTSGGQIAWRVLDKSGEIVDKGVMLPESTGKNEFQWPAKGKNIPIDVYKLEMLEFTSGRQGSAVPITIRTNVRELNVKTQTIRTSHGSFNVDQIISIISGKDNKNS